MVGITATILFSIASCILAALYGDWFSFSMILYGVCANGITLAVLGGGELSLDQTQPFVKSPRGDGILWDTNSITLLRGTERTMSTILHSRFRLKYKNDPGYLYIGLCSILVYTQFLFQLFLIPQGILIGQVLFLSTLAMSWICNGYLASFDREEMQTKILFKLIGDDFKPACYKFTCNRWSAAVAFTIAYFDFKGAEPKGILDELIPNNTPSWNLWKDCICTAIKRKICQPSSLIEARNNLDQSLKERYLTLPQEEDRTFVKVFLEQANHAFDSVEPLKQNLAKEKDGPKSAKHTSITVEN